MKTKLIVIVIVDVQLIICQLKKIMIQNSAVRTSEAG